MITSQKTSMLDAALACIAQGFSVIPLCWPDANGNCGCGKNHEGHNIGKAPITPHGLNDATQTQAGVREYWQKYPQANIGIVTDGLTVLDFDAGNSGLESKSDLEAIFGPLPRTRTHRTGGGGEHWIYRNPNGTNIRNTVKLGGYKGVDLRGTGGYIVAPPSSHLSGNRYEVIDDAEIAPTPEWLVELTSKRTPTLQTTTTGEEAPIPESERNHTLTSLAGSMRRRGMPQSAIEVALLEVNRTQCQPPLLEGEVRAIAKSVARYAPAQIPQEEVSHTDKKRPSAATLLVGLAGDIDLIHTPDGIPYAVIERDEHIETWLLASRAVKDYLARRYYEETGSAPHSQALQDALNVLRGRALFAGREESVYTRLASREGKLYLDLCDHSWRGVEVTDEGWQVISSPPVRFVRNNGMMALPEPQTSGDIRVMKKFLNVTPSDWPLLVAWLIGAFIPSGPYPVLVLTGEQGSAKSTAARLLRSLVDPSTVPLRSLPRDERDLSITASNSWLIALDNVSSLTPWLSDAISRLATGGGFATRELYTNAEEVLFAATRPVVLNGIGDIATRSDLLDRAIIVTLPTISDDKRRTEAELWGEFEQVRPSALAALLDAIVMALRDVHTVRLDATPRMADFARWVVAAAPALDMEPKDFLDAYTSNRRSVHELALESSPVAAQILALTDEFPDGGEWTGAATELLEKLNARAENGAQSRTGWPKNARSLSSTLMRLAPNLRAIGVDVTRGKEGSQRFIRIGKGTQSCVPSVFSVSPDTRGADFQDANDATRTQNSALAAPTQARHDDNDAKDANIPTHSNGNTG